MFSNMNKSKRWLRLLSLAVCQLSFGLALTSCVDNDDDVPTNRYEAERVTAAQFLEENEDRVGDFIGILKKTPYFSMLSTYGNYTVFAPNNEAIQNYLASSGYESLDNIPKDVCDTLARTHIIKDKAFFTTDVSEGSLGMNMAETYINLSINTDATNHNAVAHFANKVARMVEFDDSVNNGVVHIVNHIIPRTSDKLPDVIAADSTLTIFAQALFMTGLSDSLMAYIDKSYPDWPAGSDSISERRPLKVICKSGDGHGVGVDAEWVKKRYFKFTAFVETDSIFKMNGINNINDLIREAKRVYDDVYPEDKGLYDNDFKNRKNPLNRFISYHLIDRVLPYDEVIMSKDYMQASWVKELADPEEYYETMCPGTIMRFCYPYPDEQLYINRSYVDYQKSKNPTIKGIRVLKEQESSNALRQAPNGMYHYIDNILWYDKNVRDVVLNCRMRFDANVLSPDFMNSGARGRPLSVSGQETYVIAFRNNFIKNWKVMGDGATVGLHNDDGTWAHYKSNGVCITGIFDVTFKLPPVPKGTYEIRLGYTVGNERGVVQFYLDGVPCGIPVDLRMYGGDPKIGFVDDVTKGTEDEIINANKAIDKSMRNHGYMKAMDCYWHGPIDGWGMILRSRVGNLRYIMTTTNLKEGHDYYLRARQVLKDREGYWSFDYLELCPKNVYGSPEGEDTH